MSKKPLVILTGPTAVGKTALSIQLAKAIGGEMISADSMQVYRGMDIGTAKVTTEEMEGIPHYLIDVLDPKDGFDVVQFQQMAKSAMEDIYAHGKIPVVVGGTGFYIQALLYDIDFTESESDPSYRQKLEELGNRNGDSYLHDMLKSVDPKAAEDIHMNNRKRVIRALEYYKLTGQRISEHNEQQRQKESPYQFVYFVLNDDRQVLYERIEKRIDIMIENGLVEEVRSLQSAGCKKGMVSMDGLGYKEILDYLDGITTLEEAIDILKRDTRRFAKRQLTWFRRESDVTWIQKPDYTSEEAMLQYMLKVLKEKEIL